MIAYIILNTLLVIVVAALIPTIASAEDPPSPNVSQGTSDRLEKMSKDVNKLLEDIRKVMSAPAGASGAAPQIERYAAAMAEWSRQANALTTKERSTEGFSIFEEQLDLFKVEMQVLTEVVNGLDSAVTLTAAARERAYTDVQTNAGLAADEITRIKEQVADLPQAMDILKGFAAVSAGGAALGAMGTAFKALTTGGVAGGAAAGLKGVYGGVKTLVEQALELKGINLQAEMGKILSTAVLWPYAIDEANAQMRQALSLGPQYEDRMRKIYAGGEEAYNQGYLFKLFADSAHHLERFGFTIKDNVEIWDSLTKTESSYTRQAAETMRAMLQSVTAMRFMGASTESSTKGLNESIRSLGLGHDAALDFMGAIAATSHEINFPFSNAMDALAAQGPNLGHLGDTGTQAFRDLMVASKNANIEIGDLMSTADKYKDFEKASTLAGQFNALLEGQASLDEVALSQAVMEGRYTDFYRAIQNAFKRSGQNLDDPHLTSGLAVLMGTSTGNIRRMLTANWDAEMEGAMAASLKPEDVLSYDAGSHGEKYVASLQTFQNAATQLNQTGRFITTAMKRPAAALASLTPGGTNMEIFQALNVDPPGDIKPGAPAAFLSTLLNSWQQQLEAVLRHSATKALVPHPGATDDEGVLLDTRRSHRGRDTSETMGIGVPRAFTGDRHITLEVKLDDGSGFTGTVLKALDTAVGGGG
jgi:hypothetical protein